MKQSAQYKWVWDTKTQAVRESACMKANWTVLCFREKTQWPTCQLLTNRSNYLTDSWKIRSVFVTGEQTWAKLVVIWAFLISNLYGAFGAKKSWNLAKCNFSATYAWSFFFFFVEPILSILCLERKKMLLILPRSQLAWASKFAEGAILLFMVLLLSRYVRV